MKKYKISLSNDELETLLGILDMKIEMCEDEADSSFTQEHKKEVSKAKLLWNKLLKSKGITSWLSTYSGVK